MCNFSIKFDSDVQHVIRVAKNAITTAGGNFTGNEEEGGFEISTFMGQIIGAYTIVNNEININITKKPVFVPCSEIENQLRKYLA